MGDRGDVVRRRSFYRPGEGLTKAQQHAIVHGDVRPVDACEFEMAKFYRWPGRLYGSMPDHVSRAGPELVK